MGLFVFPEPQIAFLGADQVEKAGRCADCAEVYERDEFQPNVYWDVFRCKSESGEVNIFTRPQDAIEWCVGRGRVEIIGIAIQPIQ